MNTRVCILGCVFIVFVMLLWVSYIRKEEGYVPGLGKQEKYGMISRFGELWTSNYISGWAPDWTYQGTTPKPFMKFEGSPSNYKDSIPTSTMYFRTITQLQDGTFACLGSIRGSTPDTGLYVSTKLSGRVDDWRAVGGSLGPNLRFSLRLIQLHDGTFVALDSYNGLYTSTTLKGNASDWVKVSGDLSLFDLVQVQDGTFAAIVKNDNEYVIYTCPRLSGNKSDWTRVNGTEWKIRSLIQLQKGDFVCIHFGSHFLYVSNKLTNSGYGDWTHLVDQSLYPDTIFTYYV